MAFLDDLGKKISQAGQNVAQKTKDMTGIAKINSAISDEEKKINEICFSIGKIYVDKNGVGFEEECKVLLANANEAKAKIENYQQQVQEIKGVLVCEKCGAEVTVGSLFCNNCGNSMPKIEVEPEVKGVICSNCGHTVEGGGRFCTNCGTPVSAPQVDKKKKCVNCGTELAEGVAFCTNCGTKVESGEIQQPVVEEAKKCSNCGVEVEEGMAFCTNCGTKIELNKEIIKNTHLEKDACFCFCGVSSFYIFELMQVRLLKAY